MFWLQGEQDATRADWARAYAAHLTRFVAEVRSRWMHDPDGRVVIGLVSESRELPFGEVVRAAQREVDEADPRVSAAPSTGMALQPDHIHLSPVGMAAMGAAMFESWDPSDS